VGDAVGAKQANEGANRDVRVAAGDGGGDWAAATEASGDGDGTLLPLG